MLSELLYGQDLPSESDTPVKGQIESDQMSDSQDQGRFTSSSQEDQVSLASDKPNQGNQDQENLIPVSRNQGMETECQTSA